MKSYEIQVFLNGKWQPSVPSTARGWQKDLANHRKAYAEPARAVKIKYVRTLRVLA